MPARKNIYSDIYSFGYSKIKLFSKNDISKFKKKIISNLNSKNFIKKRFNNKNLNNYHKIVQNELIHKKFTDPKNRTLKFNQKIIQKIKNNMEIKNLVKKTWQNNSYDIKLYSKNSVRNNFAAYRLARPFEKFKDDVGGAHIDLHFNNKIHKNHKILYTFLVPVIGNDKKSTLRFAPLSHKKNHSVSNSTGLGLFLAKDFLIPKLDAEIKVENIDDGACFEIILNKNI